MSTNEASVAIKDELGSSFASEGESLDAAPPFRTLELVQMQGLAASLP
jgi:hypothetical protein